MECKPTQRLQWKQSPKDSHRWVSGNAGMDTIWCDRMHTIKWVKTYRSRFFFFFWQNGSYGNFSWTYWVTESLLHLLHAWRSACFGLSSTNSMLARQCIPSLPCLADRVDSTTGFVTIDVSTHCLCGFRSFIKLSHADLITYSYSELLHFIHDRQMWAVHHQ